MKSDKNGVINEESNLLSVVDKILSKKSTVTFVEQIESSLQKIFNCERVTLMMVNRFKKFSFRYIKDPNTGEESMKQYDFKLGFTSQVAIAGQ